MRRSGAAITVAGALIAVGSMVAFPGTSSAATSPSPFSVPGRGAAVPFTEIEAEAAATNGEQIGPDRVYTHLPSEASGRRAVRLDAPGEYVEFTLPKSANAMTVRYSVPDNAAGTGITAPVDLRINGTKLKDLQFTSRYGWFYGGYPFGNTPGDKPHHFYDETRTMFGSTLAAGTKVRIQVASTSVAPWVVVDLADFELVPDAIPRPAGSLSVDDFGADRNGTSDSTAAFQAAVDAGKAQGKEVYVPAGTYTLWDHVVVDGVTLRGAGPWYSVLTGRHPTQRNRAVGVYGKYVSGGGYTGGIRPHEAGGPSRSVTLRDFAIIGDITERVDDDQVNALGGAMTNSVVDNLWIQHTKVGAWMDGPMDNFTLKNSRILDQTADGVNFHTGVTNSTVTNTFVRNTGDDGLAMWPDRIANVNNAFTFNTVVAPVLANNIVTYGGRDIKITDNVVSDTLTNGGGIHVANRYPGVNSGQGTAVAGTITAARNTLIRAGNSDYNWNFGVGAIWFDGLNEPINATINVTDTDIIDSSYEAIQFIEGSTQTVNFSNVNIDGTGTYMIQAQAAAKTSFTNVRAAHIGAGVAIHNCVGTGFAPTYGTGNSGWSLSSTVCTGQWPAPNYIYDGSGPSPSPSPSTSPSTSPSASPSPSPSPSPTACAPGSGDLARGKTVTATSSTQAYVPANAVDGDANTYWESANNAFPQSITVDLCAVTPVQRVVLKLPPSAAWATRTQTLAVLGSTDGTNYTTLSPSAGRTFDPATGNTANIPFTTANVRYVRVTVIGNTGWPAGQLSAFEVYGTGATPSPSPSASPSQSPSPPPTGNLARGKTVTATSNTQTYVPANAVDGDANTYWESVNNAFPQTLTVDLGASVTVGRVVLKLPPSAAWGSRTQTLAILGSTDGTNYTTIAGPAGHTFDPVTGNTVTVAVPAAARRYLRLSVTGNTGWPAAQISEFEAYAS
ncbi:discoidin domain-containing protein [Microbispora triticiradicis]|uniref:Mycodextranase n=2 Tax=Microbispora TaxID=2005 RepID=A0ABY3LXE9_9ACTN|nr:MULTISPECIES: discoidin domain-containing protein [Microbispora]TLP55699.1 mycodextranase [Microbispora fusca]TYB57315.1 mycodextranase [Microbispora tritici]